MQFINIYGNYPSFSNAAAVFEYSRDDELYSRESIDSVFEPENFGKESHGERMENRKGEECDLRAASTLNCSLVEDGIEDSGWLGEILLNI